MNITEALGWATTALEARAGQWRQATEQEWIDNDEIWEAHQDERLNMVAMYEEALQVLNTFGIVALQVDEQGSIRMVNIKGNVRATSAPPEATSASNDRPSQGLSLIHI